MPTQKKTVKRKKQSASNGLLLLRLKSSKRRSNKKRKTLLGIPIQFIQPIVVIFFVVNAVCWTLFQYSYTHRPVISKIPAVKYSQVQKAPHAKVLAKSLPVHLKVPAAGVDTDIIQLGQNDDGTIETPTSYDIVGWYKYGPTPGELGPSIIVGHVDSYKGLAVFWYLKDLKPNDQIEVDREDGSVGNFAVTKVEEVAQDSFPTQEVYGAINYAGIRLITCGGIFNHDTGHYDHNIVVFGKLE